MRKVIETSCPICQATNLRVIAFSSDILEYGCKYCGCTFKVSYERVPNEEKNFARENPPPLPENPPLNEVCASTYSRRT